MLLGACSDSGGGGGPTPQNTGPQTINWWHIQNGEPLRPVWEKMAKDYHAAHPNVTVKITPLENEAFKARLTTVTQAGTPPDLFQSWGGGVLKQQVDAGLVKDLTADTEDLVASLTPNAITPYTIDGKVYGIPWDMGIVGFWYNKDLFDKAGITAPPATWAELLEDVRKLKASGVTPIALAGKDKWPGHFYWAYLSVRLAGLEALNQALTDASAWQGPGFVAAGDRLKELVDLQPFQKGYLAATYGSPDGQAAAVGNGKAAMELMGQWAPAVQSSSSSNKKGLGDKLGFFPFPAVDGGQGPPNVVFGGGNGFAVGSNAPPATIDFLKYFLSADNQRAATATGAILPTEKAATDAIKDPNLVTVSQTLSSAPGIQLYLDQAFPPAVGQQVNDSVAELIAGKASPQQVAQAISDVAKQ